jgi:hypothetical protein
MKLNKVGDPHAGDDQHRELQRMHRRQQVPGKGGASGEMDQQPRYGRHAAQVIEQRNRRQSERNREREP